MRRKINIFYVLGCAIISCISSSMLKTLIYQTLEQLNGIIKKNHITKDILKYFEFIQNNLSPQPNVGLYSYLSSHSISLDILLSFTIFYVLYVINFLRKMGDLIRSRFLVFVRASLLRGF